MTISVQSLNSIAKIAIAASLLWLPPTIAHAAILNSAQFEVALEIKDSPNAGTLNVHGMLGDGTIEGELDETPPNHIFPKSGASGLASETGRTKVFAGSGAEIGDYSSLALWTGNYTKTSPNDIFSFTITPGKLYLGDGGGITNGLLSATWAISIELDGVQEFVTSTRLEGRGGDPNTHTFRVLESGTRLSGATFNAPSVFVPQVGSFVEEAYYETDSHTGYINLNHINLGDAFDIEYNMIMIADGLGGETIAYGHIGDPFSAGGGFTASVIQIPEPSSVWLLGCGVFACVGWRRNKHRMR